MALELCSITFFYIALFRLIRRYRLISRMMPAYRGLKEASGPSQLMRIGWIGDSPAKSGLEGRALRESSSVRLSRILMRFIVC